MNMGSKYIMDNDTNHDGWLKKLNSVSTSFCLAKWKQVTLHLQFGHKHSCHHNPTHPIPLDLLKEDPSVLHNTPESISHRKQMKNGVKPSHCAYCWKAERAGSLSDRVYKSATTWANSHFDEVATNPPDYNVFPSYLEISFSNVCNMKCIYCAPHISSQWYDEIKQHGGYKFNVFGEVSTFNDFDMLDRKQSNPIPNREFNPYVDAFWKWWPELYNNLDTLRVTGGEPLLTKDTFRLLQTIKDTNSNPNLSLSFNSNLCVPEKTWNDFVQSFSDLKRNNIVNQINLYTSCEAKGARAEYIRTGMDYDLHLHRYKEFLQLSADLQDVHIKTAPNPTPGLKNKYRYKKASGIGHMCTFNLLSVTTFKDMLEDIVKIREQITYTDDIINLWDEALNWHREHKTAYRITGGDIRHYGSSVLSVIDIPFLRNPSWLSIDILTDDFQSYFEECYQYMNDTIWFSDIEKSKFNRCYNVFKQREAYKPGVEDPAKIRHNIGMNRAMFAQYVDELDRRRNTSFVKVFPEYEEFYKDCKRYK